jgi:long-chain acyl-CoA synthetase
LASLLDSSKIDNYSNDVVLSFDPDRAASTWRSLVDSLTEQGEKTALLALTKKGHQRWSYRQLSDRVLSFTNGLARAGFKRGDTVALFAENCPEWIAAVLGVIRSGAVAVPLDVQLGDQDLAHVLSDSDARAIITTRQRAKRLATLDLRRNVRLILLDAASEDERSWERFLNQDAIELPTARADDVAVLFYTSGTTGPPKGVPLSHGNIGSQLKMVKELQVVTEADRVLLPLPLHHVYPFVIGVLAPLLFSLPIILPFSLTGPQLLRALSEGGATAIVGVPRLYSAFYSGIISRIEASGQIARRVFTLLLALSSFAQTWLRLRIGKTIFHSLHKRFGRNLRLLASGGAALDPDLAAKLEALGWQIAIGYGLTETSPLLSINLPNEWRRGSVGKPFPGVKIRIDPRAIEEQEPTNDRTVGEIVARGPNVFAGYRNLPEQTQQAFSPDGWFRTGDVGYFDDGFLYVLGRVSTLIKTESGEKIQTEDVEAAYASETGIREIGVLEERGKLVALIVPRRTGPRDEAETTVRTAVEAASKRLPSYERISDYAITPDALPRTRLGKIQRHLLVPRFEKAKKAGERAIEARAMAVEEMSGEDRALLENAVAQSCWELLARRYPGKRLTPDISPQFDLGIDSLEWLDLTLEIAESSGVELTDEAIARIETVRDLLREVTEAGEGQGIDPLAQPYEILGANQKRWLEPLGPIANLTARFLYAFGRLSMRLLFRLHIEGLENLPKNKPWLLIPNHVSYLDPFAIAAVLNWNQLRHTYWAGWTGIVSANAIMRFLGWLGKILPVEPTRAARTGLALGAIILQSKKNLVWFPEGGLSPTGDLQPFKPGIGMLLERFPTDAIPVFVSGTYKAWPVGQRFPHLCPIRVLIGKPCNAQELMREGCGQKPYERIANALQEKVAALRLSWVRTTDLLPPEP